MLMGSSSECCCQAVALCVTEAVRWHLNSKQVCTSYLCSPGTAHGVHMTKMIEMTVEDLTAPLDPHGAILTMRTHRNLSLLSQRSEMEGHGRSTC